MPAGKYTLALVLSTPDMKKISVGYSTSPCRGRMPTRHRLWPTDPVIVTAMDQVEPDQRPTIHRGYFTWGAAKVVTNPAARSLRREPRDPLLRPRRPAKDPAAEGPSSTSRSTSRSRARTANRPSSGRRSPTSSISSTSRCPCSRPSRNRTKRARCWAPRRRPCRRASTPS